MTQIGMEIGMEIGCVIKGTAPDVVIFLREISASYSPCQLLYRPDQGDALQCIKLRSPHLPCFILSAVNFLSSLSMATS